MGWWMVIGTTVMGINGPAHVHSFTFGKACKHRNCAGEAMSLLKARRE